jgi:hypothetical protein
MSSNVVNTSPYLRTSRSYPQDDPHALAVEVNKTYVDIANAVNTRTIGLYPTTRPAITGNDYFFTSQKQQSFRQVYTFTTTADINLGFKLSTIYRIVQMYGTFVSGTSTFGLIPATTTPIAGQISFYIAVNNASTTSDVIKFVIGAGAPALSSGIIVVEWALNV